MVTFLAHSGGGEATRLPWLSWVSPPPPPVHLGSIRTFLGLFPPTSHAAFHNNFACGDAFIAHHVIGRGHNRWSSLLRNDADVSVE